MSPLDKQIENIKTQLINKYDPIDIILFGSCAKGRVSKSSDIDICIILDTTDRRRIVREILTSIEYAVDLEIVVYTPQEWLQNKENKATFASIINRTGVSLIG